MKVYCNDCKWYRNGGYVDHHGGALSECKHPHNFFKIPDTYVRMGTERMHPSEINKHNHCGWFKARWRARSIYA